MSTYSRDLVEALLPAVWDDSYSYGMTVEHAPDPDMPRAAVDPQRGGVLLAHLADIRKAWVLAPLTDKQRVAVLLRYGLGWSFVEIGFNQGINKVPARERAVRGVSLIMTYLNGTEATDVEDAEAA